MKISSIEVTEDEIIEFSGKQKLQAFNFELITKFEIIKSYPVGHPLLSLVIGIICLIPLFIFPFSTVFESWGSGRTIGGSYYQIKAAYAAYWSILFLPIVGLFFLWPLRKKKYNIKVYLKDDWKLMTFKKASFQEVESLAKQLKINSNKAVVWNALPLRGSHPTL